MKNAETSFCGIQIPAGIESPGDYIQGVHDAQLEIAERNHWRERGYNIDQVTGKLVPIGDA